MVNLLRYFQLFPLTAFLITARMYGMDDFAWKYGFYVGTVLAIAQIAFFIYKKELLNRFVLTANLFLSVGGIAFFLRWHPMLKFYGQYQHVVFFMVLVAVGLVTTFYSSSGFIGVEGKSPAATRRVSLYLLGASIVALIVAMSIQQYGLFTATGLGILLLIFRTYLERQL